MGKSRQTSIAQRESEWRNHVARQASSGQTIVAFCRSEAISEGCFYSWRKRLQTEANSGALTPSATPAPFIDLGMVKNADANMAMLCPDRAKQPAPSGIEVRIDLGGGIVLTIARH